MVKHPLLIWRIIFSGTTTLYALVKTAIIAENSIFYSAVSHSIKERLHSFIAPLVGIL